MELADKLEALLAEMGGRWRETPAVALVKLVQSNGETILAALRARYNHFGGLELVAVWHPTQERYTLVDRVTGRLVGSADKHNHTPAVPQYDCQGEHMSPLDELQQLGQDAEHTDALTDLTPSQQAAVDADLDARLKPWLTARAKAGRKGPDDTTEWLHELQQLGQDADTHPLTIDDLNLISDELSGADDADTRWREAVTDLAQGVRENWTRSDKDLATAERILNAAVDRAWERCAPQIEDCAGEVLRLGRELNALRAELDERCPQGDGR